LASHSPLPPKAVPTKVSARSPPVALREKKVSVVSWDDNAKMEQWIAKLVEAYGLPKTDDKK
jgi:hypothetical protein